ncbi:MAG TPA: molybdate ABC transporter substrate-binding protein [Opitutaceae bacterium]
MRPIRLFTAAIVICTTAVSAGAAHLSVFAAASLSDALQEIAPLYTKASGDTLTFNFGSSGALARQIGEGARADVILSADDLRLDQLEQAGMLLPGTRRTLLANTLVVVAAAEGGAAVSIPEDLTRASVRHVAIGEPFTVPAGAYAKEYLQTIGMWETLHAKLVPLSNVRAVLSAVAAGNAEVGFVYKTDALISKMVRIAIEVPLADGPKISYPVAVVRESRSPDAARAFLAFLGGTEARAVFASFGFLPPG